jgi:hypothetical protein
MNRLARLDDAATVVLFLGALVLPAVVGLRGEASDVSQAEARTLAPAPVWETRPAVLETFPPAFDAWMDDHFGLRPWLLPRYHRLRFQLFRISPTDEVIVGKEGFFYLTEGTLEFDPLSEEELEEWARELDRRRAFCEEQGVGYLFVVVPDKTDVYPEHLPADLERAKLRASRIDAFAAEMARRSEARVLDLAPVMRGAKASGDLFFRNDPHWNARGAHLGYRAIVDALRADLPDVEPIPWKTFGLRERRVGGGGLARMMGLVKELEERSFKLGKDGFDGCAERFDITTGPQASFGTTCAEKPHEVLMFRDSYATALTPYLSETFGRVVYLWKRPSFAAFRAAVLRERPDVVVEERVSRFLTAETSD